MEYLVIISAGLLAGIGIGLAGISAAAIIVPILSTLLGVNPYIAIGIALASDVLASGISTVTYAKHKNVDIKNGLWMMGSVLIFTMIASYISSLQNTESLGSMMNVLVIVLGISFLLRHGNTHKPKDESTRKNYRLKSVVWGCLIGIVCGYLGAGGGVMMLIVLTSILGYELKMAVGTSVFIMTFTALVGAASHIMISGTDWMMLALCTPAAVIAAKTTALYANKISDKKLNFCVGLFLILFGLTLTLIKQLA